MAPRSDRLSSLHAVPCPSSQDAPLLGRRNPNVSACPLHYGRRKPNQVEQFKIPRKSISRFFKEGMSNMEMNARIIKALELLEAAETKRDCLAEEEVHDG